MRRPARQQAHAAAPRGASPRERKRDLRTLLGIVSGDRGDLPPEGLPLSLLAELKDQIPCDELEFYGLDAGRKIELFSQLIPAGGVVPQTDIPRQPGDRRPESKHRLATAAREAHRWPQIGPHNAQSWAPPLAQRAAANSIQNGGSAGGSSVGLARWSCPSGQ